MARERLIRNDLSEAEKLFRKAESYDPQDHEFYLYMASLYREKGEPGRADWAVGKAIEYQPFPPP
jgi:Tfp pilus assembly protein PilF